MDLERVLEVFAHVLDTQIESKTARLEALAHLSVVSESRLKQVIGIISRDSNAAFNTVIVQNSIHLWLHGLSVEGFAYGARCGLTLEYHAILDMLRDIAERERLSTIEFLSNTPCFLTHHFDNLVKKMVAVMVLAMAKNPEDPTQQNWGNITPTMSYCAMLHALPAQGQTWQDEPFSPERSSCNPSHELREGELEGVMSAESQERLLAAAAAAPRRPPGHRVRVSSENFFVLQQLPVLTYDDDATLFCMETILVRLSERFLGRNMEDCIVLDAGEMTGCLKWLRKDQAGELYVTGSICPHAAFRDLYLKDYIDAEGKIVRSVPPIISRYLFPFIAPWHGSKCLMEITHMTNHKHLMSPVLSAMNMKLFNELKPKPFARLDWIYRAAIEGELMSPGVEQLGNLVQDLEDARAMYHTGSHLGDPVAWVNGLITAVYVSAATERPIMRRLNVLQTRMLIYHLDDRPDLLARTFYYLADMDDTNIENYHARVMALMRGTFEFPKVKLISDLFRALQRDFTGFSADERDGVSQARTNEHTVARVEGMFRFMLRELSKNKALLAVAAEAAVRFRTLSGAEKDGGVVVDADESDGDDGDDTDEGAVLRRDPSETLRAVGQRTVPLLLQLMSEGTKSPKRVAFDLRSLSVRSLVRTAGGNAEVRLEVAFNFASLMLAVTLGEGVGGVVTRRKFQVRFSDIDKFQRVASAKSVGTVALVLREGAKVACFGLLRVAGAKRYTQTECSDFLGAAATAVFVMTFPDKKKHFGALFDVMKMHGVARNATSPKVRRELSIRGAPPPKEASALHPACHGMKPRKPVPNAVHKGGAWIDPGMDVEGAGAADAGEEPGAAGAMDEELGAAATAAARRAAFHHASQHPAFATASGMCYRTLWDDAALDALKRAVSGQGPAALDLAAVADSCSTLSARGAKLVVKRVLPFTVAQVSSKLDGLAGRTNRPRWLDAWWEWRAKAKRERERKKAEKVRKQPAAGGGKAKRARRAS